MRVLVTGASGFIGGHVARALVTAGHDVRALVRPTSDRGALRQLPLDYVEGDLMAPVTLAAACEGVDAVVHAAAVVRGHGPWGAFRDAIEGTRNLLEAMAEGPVRRLVHVSSIGVYRMGRRDEPLRETTPLRERPPAWNHYSRQKVAMERLAWDAHENERVELVVIRPSATLGPGDRASLPAIFGALRSGKMGVLGKGDNSVPFVVVEELAGAIARATGAPDLGGQIYNLSGTLAVTQSTFLSMCARAIGVEPPHRHVPIAVAQLAATMAEWAHRARRRPGSPPMTRLGVSVATTDAVVDCSAAARDLGWSGSASYADAIARAAAAWAP